VDDQDNYGVYKEIIKEMLQFGASRVLKNNKNQTPYELLRTFE